MTFEERTLIQDQLLKLAAAKSSTLIGPYSYAFGYVFAMLTDEQLTLLKETSKSGIETLAAS